MRATRVGKCEPAPGSPLDDALELPWREMLEGALTAAFSMLRSPTEHESNPLISSIIQGYFLKLLGNYRSFIRPDAPRPSLTRPGTAPSTGPPSPHGGGGGGAGGGGAGGSGARAPPLARQSMPVKGVACEGDAIRGSGYVFDHAGLVASHRHNDKARAFLHQLRQSQMYEVFVQERLKIAADCGYDPGSGGQPGFAPGAPAAALGYGGPHNTGGSASPGPPGGGGDSGGGGGGVWDEGGDPFEERVSAYLDNRSRRLAARLNAGVRSSLTRFQAYIKKHRRTDGLPEPDLARAKQLASAFMAGAAGAVRRTLESAGGAAEPRGATGGGGAAVSGGSWGNLQQLLLQQQHGGGGGGGGGHGPGGAEAGGFGSVSSGPLAGGLARHRHSMSVDQIAGLQSAGPRGAAGGPGATRNGCRSFSAGPAGAGAAADALGQPTPSAAAGG
ncbi:hypothetical protein MNEG_15710 [Monoraphidium neglectum]|uniref:Uncharacterized protein n=1 Tax=Monoraphidium neglectum TaxID=145388 RepID=A0A0D2K7Y9_9CHLO|nr:hypothetical protein MNEG_15710 [Monoraphidium neglectum]KIY92253.1 hypothetical protein MNEG_15710 [Monoraphidium neglectum]|eukprot:XP_013891273.1 hypothetical protein MNEG_15710 [Monoraphidium neglectum]